LVYISLGGKVFITTPIVDLEEQSQHSLMLNKLITNVLLASFDGLPMVLLGSENSLTLFDVQKNAERFSIEVTEGISAMSFGTIKGQKLCVVGGNCSLLGIGECGDEKYWNVTGHTVTAIAFLDFDQDEKDELAVAS